ncbi:MAG: TIGR03435 family protein [Acidobacteria bacterium]|nr:TIGR03435 family protein [Acidobacteriota bacterium]
MRVQIAGIVLLAELYMGAPQLKRLEFEVASIKPNAAGDHRIMMQITPGGRLNVTGAALRELIRSAYRLQDFQISGGPGWVSTDRWDIQAKAEENASQDQVNEMLQNLLAERFQFKFHKEQRQIPVYELIIARNGPKLQETKPGAASATSSSHTLGIPQSHGTGSHAGGRGMTMAQLAERLGELLGRTVIDKTGLTGSYDITLSWRPEPGQGAAFSDHVRPGAGPTSPPDPNLPSIFTAIQEQLGLRLESARGPGEVMVIDSAQRPAGQR